MSAASATSIFTKRLSTGSIYCKNPAAVTSRLKVLISGGARDLFIVSDFDRTITTGEKISKRKAEQSAKTLFEFL